MKKYFISSLPSWSYHFFLCAQKTFGKVHLWSVDRSILQPFLMDRLILRSMP